MNQIEIGNLNKKKSGFIWTIILILIALIFLSYWGYDIKRLTSLPLVTKLLAFVTAVLKTFWNFLLTILDFAWTILLDIFHFIQSRL